MNKTIPYLSCVIVALALFAFTPSSYGQCNCGAEYVYVDDGGFTRIMGSIALAPGANHDFYYWAADYLDAYSYMDSMRSWGFQVNVYVPIGNCYDRFNRPCLSRN